jgi:hypothetical protein
LARPGTNATGFANYEFSIGGKWLGLLKEVAPGVRRVAIIRNTVHIRPAITSVGRKSRTSVTRVELIEAVYRRVGLSRAESARLVELLFKEIADCLKRARW